MFQTNILQNPASRVSPGECFRGQFSKLVLPLSMTQEKEEGMGILYTWRYGGRGRRERGKEEGMGLLQVEAWRRER